MMHSIEAGMVSLPFTHYSSTWYPGALGEYTMDELKELKPPTLVIHLVSNAHVVRKEPPQKRVFNPDQTLEFHIRSVPTWSAHASQDGNFTSMATGPPIL